MSHRNKTGAAEPGCAPPPLPARSGLPKLRAALTAAFALDGFLFAGWAVRIPDVQAGLGATDSELGLALLGIPIGAVATMMVTGAACTRFGARAVTVATLVLFSLAVLLPAAADSVPALTAALVVFGIGYGGANVAMNATAVDLVALLRRPVMPSFHAAFSLGGLIGALAGGALASRTGVGPHLLLAALIGLVVIGAAGAVLLTTPMPDDPHRTAPAGKAPSGDAPRTRVRRPRRVWAMVLLFSLVALCSSYGEGTIADWSAVHLKRSLAADAGTAALGFAAFSCAMTLGRAAGTRLLERLGQTAVLCGGGVLAAGGMLLAALAPTVPLALTGFVLVGLGIANTFPIAVGNAGTLAGPSGIAAASTLGYGAVLVAPVVIGFLAEATSLPTALTTVAAMAAIGAAASLLTRRGPATQAVVEPAVQPSQPGRTRPDS